MSARGGRGGRRVRRTVETTIDSGRGVFMISVAAELADMHPQTLRMYEARGLIAPQRSPKNTRLYSQRDVDRLRRIQQMTSEDGLNLAGVETVLEMEERVEEMQGRAGARPGPGRGARATGQAGDRASRQIAEDRDRPLRRIRGHSRAPG